MFTVQKRSYCYILDAVSGIFTILFNRITGQAYNVAADCSITTIREMAETAAAIGGSRVVFELPNEIEKRGSSKSQDAALDTKKLQHLEWQPSYDLKTGLEHTVAIIDQ